MSLWTGEDQSSVKCKEGADWGAEEWVTSEKLEQRGSGTQEGPPRAAGEEEGMQETHRLPADPLRPCQGEGDACSST